MPACCRLPRPLGFRSDWGASSVQRARNVWMPGCSIIAFNSACNPSVVFPDRNAPSQSLAKVGSRNAAQCLPRKSTTTSRSPGARAIHLLLQLAVDHPHGAAFTRAADFDRLGRLAEDAVEKVHEDARVGV